MFLCEKEHLAKLAISMRTARGEPDTLTRAAMVGRTETGGLGITCYRGSSTWRRGRRKRRFVRASRKWPPANGLRLERVGVRRVDVQVGGHRLEFPTSFVEKDAPKLYRLS